MTPDWKPGDRALLPVTVAHVGLEGWVQVVIGPEVDDHYHSTHGADLIPDDRRPSWLPGQPGDVAEWGGQRWLRRDWPSIANTWVSEAGEVVEDAEVPADAVLVFPAKTREVTS